MNSRSMTMIIEDLVRKVGQSCVGIHPGHNAGFFVAPDLIVTAGHVLRGRHHDTEIHLRNANVIRGKIIRVNLEDDIGLIRVDATHHSQPTLSLDRFTKPFFSSQDGTMVKLDGERGENGWMLEYETGIVSHSYHTIRTADKDGNLTGYLINPIKATIKSRSGFSGSPVVFNYPGTVCGMLVAGGDAAWCVNAYLISEEINKV